MSMISEDLLFYTYEIMQTILNHEQKIKDEIDALTDHQILTTDTDELSNYLSQKWAIELPVLGEPEVVDSRTKIEVGRNVYGQGHGYNRTIKVDGQRYTLEIPFEGDRDLFFHKSNTYTLNPPRGKIHGKTLLHSIELSEPNASKVNNEFESFIKSVNQHLDWLAPSIARFNSSIPTLVKDRTNIRRQRAEKANETMAGLKFKIKSRTTSAPYVIPVRRKKVEPTFPSAKFETKSEPYLSNAKYDEILKMLKSMSDVFERSPKAFANMDEETLRFQLLVPLNSQFEIDARGEVFNYNGKTDILITENGRNIFIAECKFWRGEDSLIDTVEQILGYLCWHDTKAAIILLNRNKDFSRVLEQIPNVITKHSNYLNTLHEGETEFTFLFRHKNDEQRKITLTVLAFDVPK